MSPHTFEGVYVALVTPFTKKREICTDSLNRHLNWLAEAGVHGFVPCGTTGESPTLSLDEWKTVVECSLAVAKKYQLKVVAGCGGNNTETALQKVQLSKQLQCDAALVVTPYYNKPTPAGVFAHYEYLAEKGDFPILLYNVPGRTNVSLSPSLVDQLFQLKNIIGIKEASGSYKQWASIATLPSKKGKALMAGDDDAFATVLALGGCGIVSAAANVHPKAFVEIFESFRAGKWQACFEKQLALQALVDALFMETNPAPAKYALHKMGRMENQLRLPLVPVSKSTEETLSSLLAKMEILA